MGKVTCANCGSKYKALYEDTDQAMGCASNVFERDGQQYVVGHYGSLIIDAKLYKILTNDHIKGIICDDCVQKGIDDNQFELVNENNYFGINL